MWFIKSVNCFVVRVSRWWIRCGESRKKDIKDIAKSLSLSNWMDGVKFAEKGKTVDEGHWESQFGWFRDEEDVSPGLHQKQSYGQILQMYVTFWAITPEHPKQEGHDARKGKQINRRVVKITTAGKWSFLPLENSGIQCRTHSSVVDDPRTNGDEVVTY